MSWKIFFIFLPSLIATDQFNIYDGSPEESSVLRAKFLKDKRKNNVTATQIKLLNKYMANDSVLIDDILHYKIKGHPQLKQVNQIEDEFRNMIAMNGVTYIFRRDVNWRTWRKVPFDKGARIVHYKYANLVNCTNCDIEGYWVIDKDPPPCALEIFSIEDNAVCALNMKHYTLKKKKCSSHLFNQLSINCDNPIVTKWIVQKTFTKKGVKQSFPDVICGGREYCRVLTVYKINPGHVSFKIINSTNHIVYSRIMKSPHDNYACVTNCGILNQDTNTVMKSENPLKLNLFNKKIEKREEFNENSGKKTIEKPKKNKKSNISSHFYVNLHSKLTTHSPSCKNLRHNHEHDDDDITIDEEDDDNVS